MIGGRYVKANSGRLASWNFPQDPEPRVRGIPAVDAIAEGCAGGYDQDHPQSRGKEPCPFLLRTTSRVSSAHEAAEQLKAVEGGEGGEPHGHVPDMCAAFPDPAKGVYNDGMGRLSRVDVSDAEQIRYLASHDVDSSAGHERSDGSPGDELDDESETAEA